jgi:hypothetical protein
MLRSLRLKSGDDEDMLEVSVVSLASLEIYQGRLTDVDFEAIRAEFAKAFRGPTPELQEKIDASIEGNLYGTGIAGEHVDYRPAVLSPGKLVGYAVTELEVPGQTATLYETAMKMQYLRGCIVQANFSIIASPGSRDRLDQAISDFVMK